MQVQVVLHFRFVDAEERAYLKDINKLTSQTIPVIEDQPYHSNNSRVKKNSSSGNNGQPNKRFVRSNNQPKERTWSRRMPEKLKAAL